jgi:hypothetical protein
VEFIGTAYAQIKPVLPFEQTDCVEIGDRFVQWLAAKRLCAPASIEPGRAHGRPNSPGLKILGPSAHLEWFDS